MILRFVRLYWPYALLVLSALVVTMMLTGCGWLSWLRGASTPAPAAPVLAGPPAPAHAPATVDPLIPLLAWLSWISVAGMAACIAVGAIVAGFRTLALTGLVAFAAVLCFARTLGQVLPWLPWIGLAITVIGGAALLVNRYRALAVCAVKQIPPEAVKLLPGVVKPTQIEKHFKALVAKVTK